MSAKKIKGIPDYRQRQKILYIDKTPLQELGMFADMLLAERRYSEAFDYLERMGDTNRLRSFLEEAKQRGDFFNFERTARKLNFDVKPAVWEELGRRAEQNGFVKYAVEAYMRASNRQRARALITEFPQLFEQVLENGKSINLDEDEEKKALPAKEITTSLPHLQKKAVSRIESPKTAAEKDPEQLARESAMKARKKKWRKKKK